MVYINVFQHKVVIVCAKSAIFAIGIKFHHMAMTITGIYETLNGKAESFFEWAQAHPKFGLLFAALLLACGSWGCCSVGSGRATGSLAASCGFSTTARPKHAA